MPKSLSVAAVEQFRRDGFYFPVPVLDADAAAHYVQALEQYESKAGVPLQGNLRHKIHLLFTWADELVHNATVLDAVEDVVGPDILCWTTDLFIKEVNDASAVSWGRDSTYWGLEPDNVVTAWVELTGATAENGCMQVIPGTYYPHNPLSRGQEIVTEVDTSTALPVLLKAGEMSLHHSKLMHGSEPNRSGGRHIGLAIRYIPPFVRQTRLRDSAMPVRGRDLMHNFDHEQRPRRDLDPGARKAHADAMARQFKALYQGTGVKPFRG